MEVLNTYQIVIRGRGTYKSNYTFTDKLVSRIIEFVTMGPFVHTGIYNPVNKRSYDAIPPKVSIHIIDRYYRAFVIDTGIPVSEEANAYLETFNNKAYDYFGAMFSVIRVRSDSNKRWYCSEFVLAFLQKYHQDKLINLSLKRSTPTAVVLQCVIALERDLEYREIGIK